MPRTQLTVHYILLTATFVLIAACTAPTAQPLETFLLIYRFDKSAFVEYSADIQPLHEIPFTIPPDCALYDVSSAPVGRYLLIELTCPSGQTVLFLDATTTPQPGPETGSTTQPVTNTDAHFLAWTSDGRAAYLKVDSLFDPHVVRAHMNGKQAELSVSLFTYDLAVHPLNDDFIFTLSRGLGYGSELQVTQSAVRNTQTLYTDQYHYIAFARYSPDGQQIAFIKIPDSQIPFTVGELWVMNADGSNPHSLADADAGHGYAANWSPDGTRLAFVARENLQDENADRASEALISNIYIVEVASGTLTQVSHFISGYVETPHWSPDGNLLVFSRVVDGRMSVLRADVASGEIQVIETESACCFAWMRK